MIKFNCSNCGERLKVPVDAAGKHGECPQCGRTLLVPQVETVILEAAEPAPSNRLRAYPAANAHSMSNSVQATPPTEPKDEKHRRWVAILIVGTVIAALFAPTISIGFGIILLVLCIVTLIPGRQTFSRRLLRLNSRDKWRSGFRLTMYGLAGLVLIIAGWNSANVKAEKKEIDARYAVEKAEQKEIAARQAAEKTEQKRLTGKANAQVVTFVKDAEATWLKGKSALARAKLESASWVLNATDFTPVQRLRARMANAEVESLMAEAINAVKAGDIDTTREKIQAALAVPHANAFAEANRLSKQIGNATDPKRIRTILMALTNEAFQRLQEGGKIPEQLVTGYKGLDRHTATLARSQFDDVAAARKKRRKAERVAKMRRQKEQRLAAAASRKAEERRMAEAKREAEERERRNTPLVVESWSWHIEHGFAIAEGEVTNRSDAPLKNIQVVVSFYTKDSQFITSSTAIVEYNPVLPGQTTPFKVYATQNPQMKSVRLDFKHLFGGSIGYKKR